MLDEARSVEPRGLGRLRLGALVLLVLGIETATWTASVGVWADDRIVAERSLSTQGGLGGALLPLIQCVLADAGRTTSDLDGVAVSIGPGSFTGLRIGLATAKGLAFSHAVPLVGVRTLPALALAAEVPDGLVCPLLDARKGEVYTALIEANGGEVRVLHAEVATNLVGWLALLGERPCVFIGDAVGLLPPRLQSEWTVRPFAQFHPRGSVIANLGHQRLLAGEADDIALLEPFYVRPSEAEIRLA